MIKVIHVIPNDDFTLTLEFNDGKKGRFDTKPYLEKGVFKELRDLKYFKKVQVKFSTTVWPHEQDFGPETLYLESN